MPAKGRPWTAVYPPSAQRALALFMLQLRVRLRSDDELLPGRSLDVDMERIGPEHAGE